MKLVDVAKRVRRGAALLDRRIPNWRTIMRKHAKQYDFGDGDCCVLGTLEHHAGILKTIKNAKARELAEQGCARYEIAAAKLGIKPDEYGFGLLGEVEDLQKPYDPNFGTSKHESEKILHDLWLAEFSK